MVSTTIGYRSKHQHSQQCKQRHTAGEIEYCEEGASASPSHAQSSDNSAETEYRPYTMLASSPASSAQLNTGSKSAAQISPVDLAIHRKARLRAGGEELGVTPSTITKRRGRVLAAGDEPDSLTISIPSQLAQSLHRHAVKGASVDFKPTLPCKGLNVVRQTAKSSKTSPSNSTATGISKKQSQPYTSFSKEHRGMPVTQRVVDACRSPRLWTEGSVATHPTANRTPVKSTAAAQQACASPCQMQDCDFSDNSDSDDCFSEQTHVPIALLDAFSPLRPRSQLSAGESRDFELDFGWDPVVRNAVMKNTFNGFGAILSH